eukprot:CAMPEP_0169103338 /NCGR_PEP_ID=MMETSP1015-20121227/22662_1 /TAXON_ID=342587 /ORGANISM="Karlodinium micrum, Strain CCMP2283" /LENGTH=421 /DNA_ID=CAMNT_0009164529 /DNA_START=116 /DNA_END=1381 /DNA_ORIENTATION=-
MQPMQVYMVAPMPAPVMMPTQTSFPGLQSERFETGSSQALLQPWSTNGWAYGGDYFDFEKAPQQVPMQNASLQEECVAHSAEPQEEVPSQFAMDMMPVTQNLAHPQEQTGTTLRRRRHQETSMQWWWNEADCVRGAEEVCAHQNVEAEGDHSQELANDLLVQLQLAGVEREAALAKFEAMAFKNETTSRAAQIALKSANSLDAAALALGLRGHVRSAVQSKYANFVLQTIIEVMPLARAGFIVDELKGSANKVARQQFGCRVLCRILEHLAPNDDSTVQLLDEILRDDVEELCYNEFGSYVARHLLEFGYARHKQKIAKVLFDDLLMYSKDKFGSHVVETALRQCSQEDQHKLANHLLHSQDDLLAVAGSQFGRHVARALFSMPGELRKKAVEVLLPVESKLKSMRYGKSVLQSLRAAAKS